MPDEIVNPRVLLVDDEPELRELLGRILTAQKLKVDLAADGLEALEMMRQTDYDLVLSDITMPRLSGLDCLTSAKCENLSAPFVFITAHGEGEKMLQAIRLGALDFITKPFRANEVVDVIHRALAIGLRRRRILQSVRATSQDLFEMVQKEESHISLMRAISNKCGNG